MTQDTSPTPPKFAPRAPGNVLLEAANERLKEPAFRESVRNMHAARYPLLKMINDLGLDYALTPEEKQVIESLSPKLVEGIRSATIAMLDRAEAAMPMDCTVTNADLARNVPVHIKLTKERGIEVIQCRPVRHQAPRDGTGSQPQGT